VYESTLDTIFEQADIVSLHVPLTPETNHLADDAFFNSFRNPIYFLNTCRGSVTDTTALLKAIENNKVKAAGLDVLENEKLDTYTESEKKLLHQLLSKQNVIITPHTAGVTVDAHYKMSKILSEKLPI
jgi:D-3-phosphoglycerate dehydrogenase